MDPLDAPLALPEVRAIQINLDRETGVWDKAVMSADAAQDSGHEKLAPHGRAGRRPSWLSPWPPSIPRGLAICAMLRGPRGDERVRMKITDVKTVLLTGPCTGDPYILTARQLRSAALIEIHTDGPHTGIGESYIGYFCPELVAAAVEYFKPILLGVDHGDRHPHAVAADVLLRELLVPRRLRAAVLSGIESALWDLKGKILGLPVYELLGGRCHDRLLAYATGGPSNYPPIT